MNEFFASQQKPCRVKKLLSAVLALLMMVSVVAANLGACTFESEESASSASKQSAVSSETVESSEAESSSETVSDDSSVEVSDDVSVEVSDGSIDVSDESSEDSSVEVSDVSDESSEDVSDETSDETSDDDTSSNGGYTGPSVTDGEGNGGNPGGGEWPSPFDEDYFDYQTEFDMEDNIFWDSLVYTGYNIEKHIADGRMWEYVLSSRKPGLGWLSDISYAGGSLGYETTEEGLPDIEFFEDHGLVCASYLAYVFFNYLPNVAGIDTSSLTMPTLSYSAHDWYKACQDWVEQGYSEYIEFDASMYGGFIKFIPEEDIPIGSVICFRNIDNPTEYCRHVAIYAGYKNGYHWVYHVGNENGPEFCVVERMSYGPGAQFPIAIITTPNFILDAMEKNG